MIENLEIMRNLFKNGNYDGKLIETRDIITFF